MLADVCIYPTNVCSARSTSSQVLNVNKFPAKLANSALEKRSQGKGDSCFHCSSNCWLSLWRWIAFSSSFLYSLPLASDFPACRVGRVYFLAPESSGSTTFFGQWNFDELDATCAPRGASVVWLGLLPSWDPSREGCVLDSCWSEENVGQVEQNWTRSETEANLSWLTASSSVLAWKMPYAEEPVRPLSAGLLRVRHDRICALTDDEIFACVLSRVRLFATLPLQLLCPRGFPGKNPGAGCHFLLQGIFPTQGLNSRLLCLPHQQLDSLPLCHLGIQSL